MFYKPNYSIDLDPFMKILKEYHLSEIQKLSIPSSEDNESTRIYNLLAIYMILLVEITKEPFFYELLAKFVFLLKEYLNSFGWDFKKKMIDLGISDEIPTIGEFCFENNCEELPEMINEFVTIFIRLDPEFSDDIKNLIDISRNFCFWLYINKFTYYKLNRVDE